MDRERLLQAYLPELESARAAISGLPGNAPTFVRPLAAITLFAHVQRRELRDETIELSEAVVERMPRDLPSVPEEWSTMSRVILADIQRRSPCTLCSVRPGYGPCPRCIGTGRIGDQRGAAMIDCPDCAEGWATCTTCDGVRHVCIATIRHVDDRDVSLRYSFVPATTTRLEEALLRHLDEETPPDCLRFELDLRAIASPYRTAETETLRGEFSGFAFEEALTRTRAAVDRLGGPGSWVREEVRAYARPFLWVGFDDARVPSVRNALFLSGPLGTSIAMTD